MRRLCLLAGALLFTGGAGCFYPADRGRALEARVDKLLGDQAALQQRVEATDQKLAATVPQIDEKLAEMTRAMENLDKASRRSGADIGVQMQKAVEDVAQLRGQVETYLHKIEELEAGLKKLSDDTDQKLLALKGEEAIKAAEAKKKAEELKRPSDPKDFFELAQTKAKDDPALGRQLYAEFLKKFPKDARVADAHFELGETFRGEDRCREALAEYGKVIQEFQKAKVTPEAYLRSSECFENLKMMDASKDALEELVKSYPSSAEAKQAKTKLDKLKKAPPPKKK